MKINFLLLAGLLISSQAMAIDKTLHPGITEHAIKLFNQSCASPLKLKSFSEQEKQRLARYTRKEDDPTLDRITNWHFHDVYHGKTNAMPTHKSLHRIFKHRVESLQAAVKYGVDRGIISNGGRVIHYLQDMGIPAHVAPNYHAKPSNWLEGIFVKKQPDPIDGMMIPDHFEYTFNETRCRELQDKNIRLMQSASNADNSYLFIFNHLLDDLANDTRKQVRDTTLPASGESFATAFWYLRGSGHSMPPNCVVEKDFEPYGRQCERARFSAADSPCKLQANQQACKGFVARRYQAIMDTTLRALMYISAFRKD
ncbi:MAG: hypothetical protein PVF81_00315 [Thioalkalispiraceae bacterium]|jgi:hypothetical protein